MADLIDSVATLTDLRDKDDLEVTLAKVMFDLIGASRLILWRLVRRDEEIRLRPCVSLPIGYYNTAEKPAFMEWRDMTLLQSRAELQHCFDTKHHSCLPPDETGLYCHLFPVSDGRDVICLLEIRLSAQLCCDQERLVFGLLRIYRNHLGILDYSDKDELTGLLNRRTFDESFKRVIGPKTSSGAAAKSLSVDRRQAVIDTALAHLAVVDIDFFKRINDQFGHPYGDEVLVLLARLMGRCFRDTDRLFRFGGEEFLVILPGTDLQEAELVLERFRATVEGFNFSQVGRVTVSIGFTSILIDDTGPNAFGRADEALYVAKHRGRNQVQSYELLIGDGGLTPRTTSDQDIEMF